LQLLSIRDELFDTFRKRHKGVMETEEVQLTQDSLHRMLRNFCEQATREKVPDNASDQEMLEVVMNRYEKELVHPIHNLLSGELARGLLIQVQKLKLDIETAMLELDQILRANEINFAILAALPAFFLSIVMLTVLRTWLKKDSKAQGRGRIARIHRRLLVVEIEKRIMQYQSYIEQGRDKDAETVFGLLIYSLERLYRVVEKPARATDEWDLVKQDLIELGRPQQQTSYKLTVTQRLVTVYDCLLPTLKRQ
jgi:nuclear-control-of-ATPase protein 2